MSPLRDKMYHLIPITRHILHMKISDHTEILRGKNRILVAVKK